MGFFSRIWGKKISQTTQNWENKDHFWIGNDSLIRWKKWPNKSSFEETCAPINIFSQGGGGGGGQGGGGAEGFPAGIRQLELLEKKASETQSHYFLFK